MDPVLSSIIHEYGPAAFPLIGLLLIWSRIVGPELRANRVEGQLWQDIAASLKQTALTNQQTATIQQRTAEMQAAAADSLAKASGKLQANPPGVTG